MKILITLSSFLTDIYCKGKNCRESHEKKFMGFEQHVAGIKCQENQKIKISQEFKVAKVWKVKKIRLTVLLIEQANAASYADDITPYSCATDIPSVALELQVSATKLFHWFKNNHLKANPGKF